MKTIVKYRAITPEDFMNLFQEVTEVIRKWPNPSGTLIKDKCDPAIIHLVETNYSEITEAESNLIIGQITFSKMNGEICIRRALAVQFDWDYEQEQIRKSKPVSIEMTLDEWVDVQKSLGGVQRPATGVLNLFEKVRRIATNANTSATNQMKPRDPLGGER